MVLQNKIAFVTGSSRGIGAAVARRFAREGAKVVVHGRDVKAIRQVVEEIDRDQGTAISVTGDVTRFADIERMRAEIESKFGPVDILVANAGGSFTPPGPLEEGRHRCGWWVGDGLKPSSRAWTALDILLVHANRENSIVR
jgi:3-oxoacyl-[acyl-carrier protein] reductase